jgi:MFS family permease
MIKKTRDLSGKNRKFHNPCISAKFEIQPDRLFRKYEKNKHMNTSASVSMENTSTEGIEWRQLWSLAALYASIVIGWIAYHNYQPKLLVQFHFTDFTFLLMVVQGIILVITPPIAGRMGDRFRFQQGSRIPVISTGISFAAMIFMAVAFTLLGSPGEVFKWVLPLLIVCWLIAMSIFTSPALSTLELFVPVDKLPRAMAILTIVANLLYSLEPVIIDLIDYLGAPITFMVGGIAVFVSGLALKRSSFSLFTIGIAQERPKTEMKLDTQKSSYGFIFFLGTALGLSTTVLFNYFPDILQADLGAFSGGLAGKWILVSVLIFSTLIILPVSNWVNKKGVEKSFWISVAVNMVSLAGVVLFHVPAIAVGMILLFTLSFTSLSVSSLPLAIERANYYEKVYCVGIFFSGVAFPDGIVEAIQAYS